MFWCTRDSCGPCGQGRTFLVDARRELSAPCGSGRRLTKGLTPEQALEAGLACEKAAEFASAKDFHA
jgi:hypothetical protein